MKVYIVSWGLARGDERIEIDAVVHTSPEDARREFDLVDLGEVATGAYAAALNQGWGTYCSLAETGMLDEREQPTDKVSAWVYDDGRTLIEERLG